MRLANARMLAEVAAGLSAPQKELSPKYFYDQRGSELFEAITRLPEYYPTRTERALLQGWMPELMAQLGIRTLIELGAGNAEKSRIILDAMRATGLAELYVPIDVSATFLSQTAAQLRREYPGLTVEPAIADIAEELNLPRRMPRPALFAFLGSTIGNFYPPAAIRLLRRVRAAMEPGDRFLMGVDLRKDIGRIEAAYNDSQGITAEFNRNMLLVLNHELGAELRSRGVRAPRVLRPGGPPDRDAPRVDARSDGDDSRTRAGPVRRGRVDPDGDQHQVRPRERSVAVRRCRAPDRGMADRSRDAVRAGGRSARMSRLGRAVLAADLAEQAFAAPPSASLTPRRIGAEAEFIPVETATWRRCPIEGEGCCATLPFLRRYGARQGWTETLTAKGTPVLHAARRRNAHLRARRPARVQLARRAARRARCCAACARWCCRSARRRPSEGITLLAVGIDPANPASSGAPLLLRTKRYSRMAEYLGAPRARRGPDDAADGRVPGEPRSR